MSEAVLIGSLVATAVATGVSTYESVQAGQAQKKAADFRAKELEQQAIEQRQQAGLQAAVEDERAMKILSSIRATAAASGVDPGAGSPLEVYSSSSEQAKINEMYIRYAGNLAASGTQAEAALTQYGGKREQTAGYLNATAGAFSGIGKMGETVVSNQDTFKIN